MSKTDMIPSFNTCLELCDYSYKRDAWSPLDSLSDLDWLDEDFEDVDVPEEFNPHTDEISSIRGMEVGDDRVDLCHNAHRLHTEIKIQSEVLGMKTSVEDTSVSKSIWNFTEITGMLPAAKEENFDYCRKVNTFDKLGFIDAPRLRIILDTHKGNMSSHSNSRTGKATMLGRDTYASRTEFRETNHLSSFIQDGFLQTVQMPDPKYLPSMMGGCGNVAPFGNHVNLYSYVKCYKHGTYERVYGTSTNELKETINLLERGLPSEPVFSKRLRDRQEYLHGTYAEFVFVPEKRTLTSPYWNVPLPLYKEIGTSIGVTSVENRLVRAKRLVSKKQASTLVEQRDRLIQVLGGLDPITELVRKKEIESRSNRKGFEGALSANSAFQRLLMRCANNSDVNKLLGDMSFRTVACGDTSFRLSHAMWLNHGGKGTILSIRDIRDSDDMYSYAELSVENSLRVEGIPLLIPSRRGILEKETKKKIGLYEISTSQEEWSDGITAKLLLEQRPILRHQVLEIYSQDLEWVNDDSMIISRIIRDNADLPRAGGYCILITNDIKLCKQACRSSSIYVLRFDPGDVIKALPRSVWSSTSVIGYDELLGVSDALKRIQIPHRKPFVYIDSGSLMSAAVHYETADTSLSKGLILRHRELLGVERIPHRKAKYRDTLYGDSGLSIHVQLFAPEIGKPLRTTLRESSRYGSDAARSRTSGPLSVSSRAKSWRESEFTV